MKQNETLYTRRTFIKKSLTVAAVSATIPTFLTRTAFALNNPFENSLLSSRPGIPDDRVLIVVQLSGGNDGLNTVIPYRNDHYYRLRPTLAIPQKDILPLNDDLGLPPEMTAFKSLYDDGLLGIIQGVGYPNPDRSHFRSMEIWQTGVVDDYERSGWIGRLFDHTCGNAHLTSFGPTLGVEVGNFLTPAFANENGIGVAVQNPQQLYKMEKLYGGSHLDFPNPATEGSPLDFLRRTAMNAAISAERINKAVHKTQNKANYPDTRFAKGLKLIAGMIAGGLDTQVYYISIGGFDTHANQTGTHERLLKTVSDAIAAFQKDVEQLEQSDRVLGLVFSEFGRRVAENDSRGTDHGQAAPMFVFGKPVKAGLIGTYPSLEHLSDGDLKFHIDFRSVYATILDDWLKADSAAILGNSFEKIPLI